MRVRVGLQARRAPALIKEAKQLVAADSANAPKAGKLIRFGSPAALAA